MESVQEKLTELLQEVVKELGAGEFLVSIEQPKDPAHGDYASNIALILGKKLGKNPMEAAEEIVKNFRLQISDFKFLDRVEIVRPGFINFTLSKAYLLTYLNKLASEGIIIPSISEFSGKKIMVEYAHPNTHKEMHIGHMRTLITGEALCRIFAAVGAEVFRANYQGDIGPHVAKALYGIEVLMEERGLVLSISPAKGEVSPAKGEALLNGNSIEDWSNKEKAHFLGEGYVRGNQDYEEHKEEIDALNTKLYRRDHSIESLYTTTRKWSLDYYEDFYKRFYTQFDKLFFESEMAGPGKKIVEENIGDVFVEEQGAVIFPGEKYALHTRVFITQAGNPTYEGKEMGNAFAEHKAFPFDLKMHIVASEQAGYFQVVLKALDLIDPKKFVNKQHHLSMGMVTLTDSSASSGHKKMSSRTGEILTVDWLIDQVKAQVEKLAKDERIKSDKREETIEAVTIGAIKYSVLRGGTGQNVAFDIKKSVSLDGDSGPYVQYTYARTQSVLGKAEGKGQILTLSLHLAAEEILLLRKLINYPDVVQRAAEKYSPNLIVSYLFEVAQTYNNFYQHHQILKASGETRSFRIMLTKATGEILEHGLNLLGIKAPEKM